MDQIVNYINAHADAYNMDARYVTLEEYFTAVYNRKMSWPIFEGDFAVYADRIHRQAARPHSILLGPTYQKPHSICT